MTAVLRSRNPRADESGRMRHSGRRVSFMGGLVILAVDEGAHKPRARRTVRRMKPSERQKLDERKGRSALPRLGRCASESILHARPPVASISS